VITEPASHRGRRASALRRIWRGLLVAGLVAGALLVIDGLLTILWQEPVTAFVQHRRQAALRDDLQQLDRQFASVAAAAPAVTAHDTQRRTRRLALRLLHSRGTGQALGKLEIPKIGLRTVLVENTSGSALRRGPGHYRGTVLPGLDGTVGIAGHRTTYGAPFRHVDQLRRGSRIVLRMPYGRFTYAVTGTRITTPDDASSLRSHAGTRRLVLTACHPLYSAAKRIVVSARLVGESAPA
jgi:sortase A